MDFIVPRAARQTGGAVLALCTLGTLALIGLPHKRSNTAALEELQEQPAPRRPAPDQGALRRVCAELAPPADGQPLDEAALVERIARIGPAGLDACVALLCGEAEGPEVAAGTMDGAIHPAAIEGQERILRSAIARFAPAHQLECLIQRGAGAPLDVRLVLIRLLGETTHPRAAQEIVRLCQEIEEIHLHRDYVTGGIEAALSARIAANPLALTELRRYFSKQPLPLNALLVRAIAQVEGTPSLELLSDLLGRDEQLDPLLMSSLGRLTASGRMVLDDTVLRRARSAVGSERSEVRCAALELLGTQGDERDAEVLIENLECDDALTEQTARRALARMSGVDLGADKQPWSDWLDSESVWIANDYEATLFAIQSSGRSEALTALRALEHHPLVWRRCAEPLGAALEGTQDAERAAALVSTIVVCGARGALPSLIDELEREDSARRTRALAGLKALTALDLGEDPSAWRDALLDAR